MHLSNFNDVLTSSKPVLVDFWAPWCMPCQRLAPIVDRLARDFDVFKVNVEKDPRLAARFRVSTLPTLLIIRDGEELARTVGVRSESDLRNALDQMS